MPEPVRIRRLTDQEGQKLQQMRRGSTSSVRFRRATLLLASAGGNRVPVIAQLVQADEKWARPSVAWKKSWTGTKPGHFEAPESQHT